MSNSQKEESKKENEIEEPKKDNKININNINDGNLNNSERSSLKHSNINFKQIEKENTEINIIPEEVYLNKKNNEETQIEKKEISTEIKELHIEIKEEKKFQKIIKISEYFNLPKIKNGKEYTKAEIFIMDIKEAEDNCKKCPQRCLLFIPIFIGYFFLSIFDFLTYLIVPLIYCLFYTIVSIFNYCKNIVSQNQVEEEIGFSGAFTSENEIKIHVAVQGGVMHLNEILCFSYMSACAKRYFCFIFVIINHIIVSILQAWKKARDCFIQSRIEQEYDSRMEQIEEAKKYRGFNQVETEIEIDNY